MPHKSETPHDGGASRNSCGGTFRDPNTPADLNSQLSDAVGLDRPGGGAMSEREHTPHLRLVSDNGSAFAGAQDRQWPKGFRAVESRDGWRVGIWCENFRSFHAFHTRPFSTLAEAERGIEQMRAQDLRPIYPPKHYRGRRSHG